MRLTILPVALLLLGCAPEIPDSSPRPVIIQTIADDRSPYSPPPVETFRPRDVNWTVVTPANAESIFDQMQAKGEPLVLFGVNEQGYENIAINNREALRVIMQQRSVIRGYREYYVRVP